jgi:hypothetical protein
MTIHYQPQLREQLDAARQYQRSTSKHRLYRVGSLLALGAAVWMLATGGPALLIVIWVALAVFMWFDPVPLLLTRLSYGSRALRQTYQATFDEEGIVFEIGGQMVRRPWSRYTRVLESPDLFVLVYGPWSYSVIPKRAFADDAERDRFRALCRQGMGTQSDA